VDAYLVLSAPGHSSGRPRYKIQDTRYFNRYFEPLSSPRRSLHSRNSERLETHDVEGWFGKGLGLRPSLSTDRKEINAAREVWSVATRRKGAKACASLNRVEQINPNFFFDVG
jgi:hypothetical protein